MATKQTIKTYMKKPKRKGRATKLKNKHKSTKPYMGQGKGK